MNSASASKSSSDPPIGSDRKGIQSSQVCFECMNVLHTILCVDWLKECNCAKLGKIHWIFTTYFLCRDINSTLSQDYCSLSLQKIGLAF